MKGHAKDKEVTVVNGYSHSIFVNIGPTSPKGIKQVYDVRFADNHLADVTAAPFLYAIDSLFKLESKGRVFSIFCYLIEPAMSMSKLHTIR